MRQRKKERCVTGWYSDGPDIKTIVISRLGIVKNPPIVKKMLIFGEIDVWHLTQNYHFFQFQEKKFKFLSMYIFFICDRTKNNKTCQNQKSIDRSGIAVPLSLQVAVLVLPLIGFLIPGSSNLAPSDVSCNSKHNRIHLGPRCW